MPMLLASAVIFTGRLYLRNTSRVALTSDFSSFPTPLCDFLFKQRPGFFEFLLVVLRIQHNLKYTFDRIQTFKCTVPVVTFLVAVSRF